jgi:hypothetical protein
MQLLDPVDSTAEDQRPTILETEPNDRASEAQVLLPGSALLGASSRRGDSDWFRLELPAERELRVKVIPDPTLDVTLSLHGAKGERTLRRIHNGKKGDPEVISNVVMEGTGLIRVKSKRGTGAYRLLLTALPVAESSEREPNGSIRNATPLTVGSEIRGFANNDEDRDLFVITPTAEAPQGPWLLEATGVEGASLRMTVFRTTRSEGSHVRLSPDQPVIVPGIAPADSKHPVHVSVRCTSGFNVDTPYSLRLLTDPSALESLPEPNNSRSTSGKLKMDVPMPGAIQWAGDLDSWTLLDVPEGVLRIEASGIPGMRLKLRVLGAEDAPLGESISPRPGAPVTIPNVSGAGIPLFIQVSALDDLFDARQIFTLEATWRDSAGEEREPNNSVEAPDPSPLGTAMARRGFLASSNDRDVYRYRHDGKPALLILRLRAPPNLPASVRLLDRSGQEIAATGLVPPGNARTLTQYFEPGDYYVEVRGGDGYHAEAPYTIALLP